MDQTHNWQAYERKVDQAKVDFDQLKTLKEVSLKPKSTTHFFRVRNKKHKLDLRKFNQVIEVDTVNQIVYVEGCTRFFDLAHETLKFGLLPPVVPELRNITIGGTVSGLGVEASSFKYGMVHNTILEYQVLTGEGEVVTCNTDTNSDLFYALPNSLGTIGYVLSCKVKLVPAKPFIRLKCTTFDNPQSYFDQLATKCAAGTADFIEGYLDQPEKLKLVEGYFVDHFNPAKAYDWRQAAFWKFLQASPDGEYYLNIEDYLWRWDRDTYWTLNNFGVVSKLINNPIFRKIFGNLTLRSDVWVMLNTRTQTLRNSRFYKKLTHNDKTENILQDFLLDVFKGKAYLAWHNQHINVYPMWICPIKNDYAGNYPMHKLAGEYLIDIGIYTGKEKAPEVPEGYYNGLLDQEIINLNGFKGLYSTTNVTESEFWSKFDKDNYSKAKIKYDPNKTFPDVFRKAVGTNTL